MPMSLEAWVLAGVLRGWGQGMGLLCNQENTAPGHKFFPLMRVAKCWSFSGPGECLIAFLGPPLREGDRAAGGVPRPGFIGGTASPGALSWSRAGIPWQTRPLPALPPLTPRPDAKGRRKTQSSQKELEASRSCQTSSALSVDTVVQHLVARRPDVPWRGAPTPPFAQTLAELARAGDAPTLGRERPCRVPLPGL